METKIQFFSDMQGEKSFEKASYSLCFPDKSINWGHFFLHLMQLHIPETNVIVGRCLGIIWQMEHSVEMI